MMRRLIPTLILLWLAAGSAGRAEDHFFDSAGVRIHYTELGKGEPVVLIHGLTVNGRLQWFLPGIAQDLAKHYRVIVPDCRGHGLSGKPHDPRQYGPEMAEDVVRLLDHLGIRKAHVVGYSMGGFITLHLLGTHPDRLLTAVTGGAGLPRDHETGFVNRLADEMAQGHGMGLLLGRLTPPGAMPPTAEQVRTADGFVATFNDSKALAAAVRSLPALALPEGTLARNRVPVLALVGDGDPLKAGVESMRGRVSNLATVVVKNANHMNAFEKPQFIRALREFLASHGEAVPARRPVAECAPGCCDVP